MGSRWGRRGRPSVNAVLLNINNQNDDQMDTNDYECRRAFVEVIKTMTHSECIEIARILKKHNVSTSENRNGIYFDLSQVSATVFAELQQFHNFVLQNNKELEKQEMEKQELERGIKETTT